MMQRSAIGNLIDDQKAIMDFESERGESLGHKQGNALLER